MASPGTPGVRLDRHERNGMAVAKWLAQQEHVAQVLYPALDSGPDRPLWKVTLPGQAA